MTRTQHITALHVATLVLTISIAIDASIAADTAVDTTADPSWKAGVAKAVITASEPMWMSGYAGRDKPAEGKVHDLWAKALALEDPSGKRVLLITLDLVGIDRATSLAIRQSIRGKHALTFDRIIVSTSHTHCGPVTGDNLMSMYFLTPEHLKRVQDYTAWLKREVVRVAGEAIEHMQPCTLAYGVGKATFAVNRRNNPEAQVPKLREEGNLRGPVDHDVNVLRVVGADGKLRAVVCGYACHATTLSFFQWSGDYPGFAQTALEERHPGAVAMFVAGCGGDINPLPRRTVELAQQYGAQLADGVDAALATPMTAIKNKVATDYREVDLPFDTLPTRAELDEQSQSTNKYIASRAKRLIAQIDAGTPLSPTYPYPIAAWRFGDDLLLVALGGEVVVDYSLRLKKELGARTWVAAYCNDVMAYIPSERVLGEGGYEGGGAMVYYGQPTKWKTGVEATIIDAVHKSVEAAQSNKTK